MDITGCFGQHAQLYVPMGRKTLRKPQKFECSVQGVQQQLKLTSGASSKTTQF